MVFIKIDGKALDREFQNMAQALAFAYQNGNCYAAEKVEIAVQETETKKPAEPVTNTNVPDPVITDPAPGDDPVTE